MIGQDFPSKQVVAAPVYIYGHLKNSFGARPYAATEMRKALASGKPLTIKATGVTGILMAYDITPAE